MPLNWTPFAVPGLLVLVFGLSLAWLVYRSRPDRTQNRRLALQLVVEAPVVAVLSGGIWIFDHALTVAGLTLAANFLVWPKLWTYYSFLATLDTPLARPLRSRRRLNILLVATLLAGATVAIWPEWYAGEVFYWPAVDALHVAPGTAFVPIFWMWGLMWLVGLSLSVSAFRTARTELRRDQARTYMMASVSRDSAFLAVVVFLTLVPPTAPYFHWIFVVFPAIWLAYFPLVAYGILKHQLFDIDLRLKVTAQRSTVLTGLAGVFFIGSETLEQFIPADGLVLGVLAATAVAVAFVPVQRLAKGLMDRAMPNITDSASYLTDRKDQVYRDAIEAALQDGTVTDLERGILGRIQESLGIEDHVAARIETQTRAALTRPGADTAAATI